MTLDQLVEELSDNLGLVGIEPSEDGIYELLCDGIALSLSPVKEEGVMFHAVLAEAPERGAEKLSSVLLTLNHLFTGGEGATFSRSPEDGSFCLQRFEKLAGLSYEEFAAVLNSFIGTAVRWSRLIAQYDPDNPGKMNPERDFEPEESPFAELPGSTWLNV